MSLWLFASEPEKMSIADAKQKHQQSLLALSGVVSVGIGLHQQQEVIVIGIQQDSKRVRQQLPSELEGFPVLVEVIGVPR
ncbi:MAG: hypothetical protein Q9N68_11845, partial [Gammaproteobacteria bacterium]|nr:hypothetical protein [Gammaproteobacteria bacterium]